MNVKAEAGESVFNLAKRAIEMAKQRGCGVGMTHNNITVSVYPESYLHDILEKFSYLDAYNRIKNKN